MHLSKQMSLAEIFPDWRLDRRDMVWLWLRLREKDVKLPMEEFDTPIMRERMAEYVDKWRLDLRLKDEKAWEMLPEHCLPDVGKNPRAMRWLTRALQREEESLRGVVLPKVLSDWEYLVALIDTWHFSHEQKLTSLNKLHERWVLHLQDDKYFRWFKESDPKKRCELAWEWYQKQPLPFIRYEKPFTNYDDLLLFWDSSRLKLDEKRLHINEIKRQWKNLQTKKNQEGKKQSNFALPEDVTIQLNTLAAQYGYTKKQVVEKLIRHAAKNGLPE